MQTTFIKFTVSAAMMAALSGCFRTENADFNQQGRDLTRAIAEHNTLDFVEDVEDLPTGSATYRGSAGFAYDDPDLSSSEEYDLLADMELTADFDDNSVTGTLDSFNDPEGGVTGADIAVNDGIIVDTAVRAEIDGNIAGDLTTSAGEDLSIEANIDAGFKGDDAEAVAGTFEGTYVLDGEEGELYGIFSLDQ